jgi:hypothetical protein
VEPRDEATLDKLERFLPDAKPWGFTPELAEPPGAVNFAAHLKNLRVRRRKLQEPIVLSKLTQALSEILGASQQ